MPGNNEDKVWQQWNPPRKPVNEIATNQGAPFAPANPPPHPPQEPNRDWAWQEH